MRHDDNKKFIHGTGFATRRSRVGGRKFSKARSIAERLGICSRTIFRWADGVKITRHKINARVVLFDEVEVIAFIESARVGYCGTISTT